MKNKIIINIISISLIFLIDRFSKLLIIYLKEENNQASFTLTSFLNINLVWNEGIAFGLLSFENDLGYSLLSFFIFIVILILIIMLFKTEKLNRLAFIMVIGGALGNFFDRIYYSAVPDFIEIYYKSFHWFIFNVADIFITLGVCCLIYVELISKDGLNEKKS
tara:strand:- start:26 stop:514 length:489 start_codon:yes stop_codon:yes gene_type:complete